MPSSLSGIAPPTAKADPYEAAKELRTLLRHLEVAFVEGGYEDSETGEYVETPQMSMWVKKAWLDNQLAYAGELKQHIEKAKATISGIEQALKDRKTTPGLAELGVLSLNLQRALAYESSIVARLAALPTEPSGGTEDFVALTRRAYKLAQCLPTVKDLPLTPAENTLRAIIALLRNHKWPDLEGVTQATTITEKEVENGEVTQPLLSAVEGLAAAAGPPVPVGPAPEHIYSDEGDEDGDAD